MFRIAQEKDIDRIAEIYTAIHEREESGQAVIGWIRSIYPTRKTAEQSVLDKDMYVEEHDGRIVAAGRINRAQGAEYADGAWRYDGPAHEIMVLHTLVVDPALKGGGFGTAFVKFYEQLALSQGCRYLRMDTNERNTAARAFYKKLGFHECGIVPCVFNGIPNVHLVLLEKKLG